jgi:nucleoside-diphosphate-sugar epimerase/predicted dehydrogenase
VQSAPHRPDGARRRDSLCGRFRRRIPLPATRDLRAPSNVTPTPSPQSVSFPPKNNQPTRVALIGAGFIADFHLEVLSKLDQIQVVAVVDPMLQRAQDLAGKWSVPHAIQQISDLPELGIHVAHLLAPPHLHERLCRELLELGIGVFSEKPFVLCASDARSLAQLADDRGLPLGVNHNHVFQPAFTRLMQQVKAGDIGAVEHVQVTWSVPLMQLDAEQYSHWMFRSPRNILYEQGPHPLSQLHRLVGKVESCHTEILSKRELLPGQTFLDRWAVSAKGERATAEIYLAWGQGFTRNTITVIGSDGMLEADFTHDSLCSERKSPWLEFWNSFLAGWRRGTSRNKEALRVLKDWMSSTLGLAQREDAFFVGMRESIAAFHVALRAGAPLPVDAHQAAEVLDWCDVIAKDVPDVDAEELALTTEPARPGEVFVLGGTGFIGKRVVRDLLAKNTPVTCLVRRTHSLPEIVEQAAKDGRVRLVRGSLENADELTDLFDGCSAVVHLATGGGDTWEEVERTMVQGSVTVAQAAQRAGVQRFVYVSSIASLYTGDLGTLRDSTQTDPMIDERAVYSRGKAATEQALLKLHRDSGAPIIIMRPGVVVGEGTPMQHSGYGLWARDNHCVGWGIGDNQLPLVWVEDVASALAAAALHEGPELIGQSMNLCARVPLNAQRIVAELRKATGRDLHFHPRPLGKSQAMEIGKWAVKLVGGRPGLVFPSNRDLRSRALFPEFSCNLAREVLGWEPLEEPEEFLDKTVRIYAKQGD